jgi:hypothetical protein
MGRIHSRDESHKLLRRQQQRDKDHIGEILQAMESGTDIDDAIEASKKFNASRSRIDVPQSVQVNSPKSEAILHIPDSRQNMNDYSANNIAGYLMGRRISAIVPEAKQSTCKQRSDFIRGLVAGLSRSVLKDFADEKTTGLKVKFGKGLEMLKTDFSALKQAGRGDGKQNWASRDIVSSTLQSLSKLKVKDFTRITGLDAIGKEIYKNISRFWDIIAFKPSDRDPEVQLAAI